MTRLFANNSLAYENIIKQKDESIKYLNKFGAADGTPEAKALFAQIQELNTQHSAMIKGKNGFFDGDVFHCISKRILRDFVGG
jgi:hypothetical protein